MDTIRSAARPSSPNGTKGPPFVHLKVHSAYSLLEGALTIPRLAKLAVAQRLSRARADRHQQPVRRARVLRQAGRTPASSRSSAARCRSISATGRRPTACSAPAPTSRARSRPARMALLASRRARLPEPDEARLLRLLRPGRGRAAASRDRAPGGARRGPDRADRRTRRPDRSGAARGPEGGGARAPQDAGEDLRRPPLRRDPAPRPEARDRDRAGAARARLCARAADRRHQRGLLRLARRLRGARRAAVHRRGPLRRRGRPAPPVARALLQDRRADGGAVRRPAGGAGQHGRDRPALRLPAARAASRSCRASSPPAPGASDGGAAASSRRPSCASRPRPASSGALAASAAGAGLHARRTTRSASPSRST